jgi:RNA polymerase sigma-70 factor (ECF subfamily)
MRATFFLSATTGGEPPAAASRSTEGAPADEPRVRAAALAGDRAAWAALIARHDRKVVVALLAQRVPIDRARELAQETWLRLIEQAASGRLASLDLPGLAITQARFLLIDHARAAVTRSGAPEGELGRLADDAPTAEDRLLGRERLRRAEEALADCSASARAVFALMYGEPPASAAETAARTGLSVQRVRQIVCEVRKRLRAALEETS